MEKINSIPKKLQLQFGDLYLTKKVEARLEELGFEPSVLQEEILLHESSGSGSPAVYCGTYGKYNGGDITGLWVDLTTFNDYDEFKNFCMAIHADEDDPELMFQDYECFPNEWYCESCLDEETFDKIQKYIELCDEYDKEAVEAFMDWGAEDLNDFEECYVGEFSSEVDFAEHIIGECYDLENLMGNLSIYFDYKAFASDLFMDGYYYDNGYVFRRC